MADQSFDVVILGGGPGGYVAAIRAAQLGMKSAVVEREHLGGICLNWGCIPTKALLRTSEINHLLHHLPEYGFAAVKPEFDLDKVVKRSRAVAKQLSSGVAHLMRKHKITVFDGSGGLAGKQTVAVTKDGKPLATLKSPHIILATGARARQLPGIEADGKLIWTYKDAMVPTEFPKSLLVIGSGAIGIEFASFYLNMGSAVTVVEVLPRILPVEDAEISAFAHKAFEKQGMKILAGAAVKGVKKGSQNITVTVEAGGKIAGDHCGSGDFRRGDRRQCREHRAGGNRREGRSHACRDRRISAAPGNRGFMRSATSPARHGSRTRRCMKACCASRRSPAVMTCIRWMSATFPAARIAGRRLPRSG